ncbi:LuxR C-terminal-related transcriptional regulator [Flagellimonas sp.]|uniref:LuxR C-terminal-related transcriptional regulator n=1 Tax=Flagellimonas sp. TaxID=2058762 RepID=UPI003B53058A
MTDRDYFSHLYAIASQLNKEFSLYSVLRKSLEKMAEILDMDTGWIWLTEPDNKSVYLAVSHNLPPALSNHPERLAGRCYCIKQYLSDEMDQALNISEIACTRLQDISTGTNDLRFHATIPIHVNDEKVGLINLLSKETRKLNQKELTILNTISELVGAAIQRTRLQPPFHPKIAHSESTLAKVSKKVIFPELEEIKACLESSTSDQGTLKEVHQKLGDLHSNLSQLFRETEDLEDADSSVPSFHYPDLPITKRELQVLHLIKEGLTNKQIGEQLFITERTVKFHITAILSKLNANNRTEAVDIGLKRGLLSV